MNHSTCLDGVGSWLSIPATQVCVCVCVCVCACICTSMTSSLSIQRRAKFFLKFAGYGDWPGRLVVLQQSRKRLDCEVVPRHAHTILDPTCVHTTDPNFKFRAKFPFTHMYNRVVVLELCVGAEEGFSLWAVPKTWSWLSVFAATCVCVCVHVCVVRPNLI